MHAKIEIFKVIVIEQLVNTLNNLNNNDFSTIVKQIKEKRRNEFRVDIWPWPNDFLADWPIWPIGQWPMAKIGSQNIIGKLAAAKIFVVVRV